MLAHFLFTKSGFKTKAEAEKAGTIAYNEYMQTGHSFVPSTMSYSDYLDYWLKEHCEINLKYNTIEAYDGETAIDMAFDEKPDLILLDIMLPKIDGLTVCKRIRNSLNIPIIMISAKDEEIDKILGLELGADDYITKPFSVRELMARVKANLRKAELNFNRKLEEKVKVNEKAHEKDKTIEIGELFINLDKFEVKVRNKPIELTLREFEVLRYLANQPGQVVTREALLEKVWGYEYYGDIRTVDVTIRRIREKIEVDTSSPKLLITKRGVGYYLSSKEKEDNG